MTDLAPAYAACEALLRAEDRDAWLAALLAPAASRPHLHALSAFALELRHVRQRVHQAVAGEIRLQWWQEVVDGTRAGEAAAHPVAAALVDTMARAALPAAPVGDMIDAFRMGLYDESPADLPALARRLAATHGTPMRLAARVLGGGPGLDPAADDAGTALGLAELLGAVGEQAVLLPEALLVRHGARRADAQAGQATPALRAVLADLRAEARAAASDTPRIAFAPSLAFVGVPSSAIMARSSSTWCSTGMPFKASKIGFMLPMARVTPLPPNRALSPSRNSTAS